MSVVGIDISEKRVACSFVSEDGATLYANGFWHTAPDQWALRSVIIDDFLDNCTRSRVGLEDSLTDVYVEDAYIGVNRRGSINHAKVVGCALGAVALYSNYVLASTILPAVWRSRCGIKGRGKQPIMDWAVDKYGEMDNQDLADSACIAYAGASIHMDVVNKLREGGVL